MKEEYDFSHGERGKFFRNAAKFHLPIYLDEDNQALVESIAERKGSDVSSVVNEWIRSDHNSNGVTD